MTKSPGRTIKKDYFHRNPEDLPSGPTGHLTRKRPLWPSKAPPPYPLLALVDPAPPWDTFALSLKYNLWINVIKLSQLLAYTHDLFLQIWATAHHLQNTYG